MDNKIRRPLYSGSQLVRALWFAGDGDLARRRVLKHWESGARAYKAHGGYLLEWAAARRLQCELLDGLPLCEQGGLLTSAPLQADERDGIAPGHAVLVQGAALYACELVAATRIDPSRWLDLSALPIRMPLAVPVRRSQGFVSAMSEAAPDVRALLGKAVPPPSTQQAEFLRKAAAASAGARGSAGGSVGSTVLKTLGFAAMAGGALVGGAVGLLAGLAKGAGGQAGAGQAGAGPLPRQDGPTPVRNWLAGRFARLAMLTRLSSVLGWRQANYLRKMLKQFEDGNLDEALRYAIPLDSRFDAARQAFGTPGRRNSLEISGSGRNHAGIGLGQDDTAQLRAVYRRSFEALDRAGRVDEAVFVLAELLSCGAEAVDYLERKGRVEQAARLAETLELDAGLQVRLYFLAGDVERAIALARLHGCFGAALSELERRRHALSAAVRLHWAAELAASGKPAEAALVAWPLRDERQRALAWLQLAGQAGGTMGVQGLVYRLALDPEGLQACAHAVLALLEAEGEEAWQQRVRAADCIRTLDTHSAATRRLAGELWRVLLADRANHGNTVARSDMARLLELSGDPVLRADQPTENLKDPKPAASLAQRTAPLTVVLAERGLREMREVRRLPDGGYLLALGDAGVMQVRRDGSVVALFPVPANHLVVSANGQRVLALARRERVVRTGRIDLLTRKVSDWFSARLDFWAPQFDGSSWSVVADGSLMVLDAGAPGQSVLWKVGELPGRILQFLQRDDDQLLLFALADGTVEQWRYLLPQRRLIQREQFPVDRETEHVIAQVPHPCQFGLAAQEGAGSILTLLSSSPQRAICTVGEQPGVSLSGDMILCSDAGPDGWRARLLTKQGRLLAEVGLPLAMRPGAAVHQDHLLAWDACGRIVDIDLGTSAVHTLVLG
jgi:hypothetical protein